MGSFPSFRWLSVLALTLGALPLAAAPASAQKAPAAWIVDPVHHMAHVRAADAAALARLMALDLDLASCAHGGSADTRFPRTLDVVVTDADLARIRGAGFRAVVTIPRLEEHYARQAAAAGTSTDLPNPPLGQGAMGGHWTLAQMESILDDLANRFPGTCNSKTSIGRSVEGRELWMVKISDNVQVDEGEPEVLFDALHHAREPLSMEATVVFMEWLLEQRALGDPMASFLVDERELYFVPCVNPDGYEYNRRTNPGGGGLWRKNRRDNGDGTFGVDLNRNYSTGFNAPNGGNSTRTSSQVYRGPAPFSEPESRALRDFTLRRAFTQVFSTHTYTDVLLAPWGYQPQAPANAAAYQRLGAEMTRENGIAAGQTYQLLYPAAGVALDWHHAQGAYAWTPELGRADEGGFWPSGQRILDIANRHQPMFRAMARTAGAWLVLADVSLREDPANSDGDGRVEAGEVGLLTVTVHNRGVLPTPGTATVDLEPSPPGGGWTVVRGRAALGVVPSFGTATDSSTLALRLDPGFSGALVPVALRVRGDGGDWRVQRTLLAAGLRTAVSDDFEADRGFALDPTATARTGNWARGAPQRTQSGGRTIQPGSQTTPGGSLCWVTDPVAGATAGAYDVDGGPTVLESPVLDLRHLGFVRLRMKRWTVDSNGDDAFTVRLSRDGGATYGEVLFQSAASTTNGWETLEIDVGGVPTSAMRFRFEVADLNPSLLEAAVDDFEILGAGVDGSITVLTSGRLGDLARFGVVGAPGASVAVFGSLLPPDGNLRVRGIEGVFALDTRALLQVPTAAVPSGGTLEFELGIPADPALAGQTISFQCLHGAGAVRRFGNVTSVTFR